MKIYLLVLLIIIGLTYQVQGQSQSDLLNKSYNEKSLELLCQFFDNWSNETSISDSDYRELNDTSKAIYNVFKEFYKPTQLSRLSNSDWNDSVYLKSKYFIVQNSIDKILFTYKIYFTDSEIDSFATAKISFLYKADTLKKNELLKRENGKLKKHIIDAFGPKYWQQYDSKSIIVDSLFRLYPLIDYSEIKPLILTSKYEKLMNEFLGAKYGLKKNIKKDYQSRKEFLDNLITFHSGDYGWNLVTYPYVNSITFDKNMKYAKIEFEIFRRGGIAILERKGNNWRIIQIERTWVE